MTTKAKCKESMSPIINISLQNYDAHLQDTYSKKFMLPLLDALLKRIKLAQTAIRKTDN